MATPLSMVFDIVAVDRASAVFGRVGAAAGAAGDKSAAGMAKVGAAIDKMNKVAFTAAAGAAVLSVKMAADFQTATNLLVTSAGESAAALESDRKGLLAMAGQVGASATSLAQALYIVNSAGIHGANGLNVLKAAAQGAAAEGANIETVANGVTTALNAYKLPATAATAVTNQFVQIVSLGKTRMQDLSSAIAGVLPVASAAHISFAQVGGAMATMTAQGTSADVAATYLRQTIGQLSNPTLKAQNEFKALGLNAVDLSNHLGDRGLSGTLQIMYDAIAKHLGPDGMSVVLDAMAKSKGSVNGFQDALTNLPPKVQSSVGAIATMVGGTRTMMAALELGGSHMQTFTDNVAKVGAASKNASGDVVGFDRVQTSFNQKLAEFKANVGALAIELGTHLLPMLSSVFDYLNSHQNIMVAAAAVIGVMATNFVVTRVAMAAWTTVSAVVTVATKAWAAAQWLLNAALDANPISLVIIGIAALVAGIVVAYQHSETFRDIVQGAFHAVADACSFMWDKVVRPVLKEYIDLWTTVVGAMVDGAAKAFGWVPGIGPKLKEAAKTFDTFRDDVNNALGGITDKNVKVSAVTYAGQTATTLGPPSQAASVTYGGQTSSTLGPVIKKAAGGMVPLMPGSVRGRDSVPALLMPHEYVIRADGSNLGDAIAHFGQRMADGGPVGLNVQAVANAAPIVNYMQSFVGDVIKQAHAQAAATYGGMFGTPGSAGGAARWAPLVAQVVAMLNGPASAVPGILSLINSESGGNQNAINLTDSNARAGHPSMGLMQTIIGTFLAYAGPFRDRGPYDPEANIYAGVNYAMQRYGWGMLAAGGRHSASGGYLGYATGTNWVPSTGPYILHEGEAVIPRNRNDGSHNSNGPTVIHLFDVNNVLIGTMQGEIASADRQAARQVKLGAR